MFGAGDSEEPSRAFQLTLGPVLTGWVLILSRRKRARNVMKGSGRRTAQNGMSAPARAARGLADGIRRCACPGKKAGIEPFLISVLAAKPAR